jgi:hypothetical protein
MSLDGPAWVGFAYMLLPPLAPVQKGNPPAGGKHSGDATGKDTMLSMLAPRIWTRLALVGLLLIVRPATAITLSVEDTRGRSALLAVDSTTAGSVVAASPWQALIEDPSRQDVSLVELSAQGDRAVALVNHDPSPAGRVETVQVLATRLEAGGAYQLSLQARGRVLADGEAQAYVEGRSPGGAWEELLRLVLDVSGEWLDTSGQLRGRDGHQEVRVGLRLRGRGSLYVDAVHLAAVHSEENLLRDGGFEGGAYWQIEHRLQAPGADWQGNPAVIREPTFRCLGLLPGTMYEARARLVSAVGRLLEESPVVQFRTQDEDTAAADGLRVTEAVPLAPPGLTSPCLAPISEGALLVAGHGGGVYSHAVLPTGELAPPVQIAPAISVDGSPAPIDDIHCCTVGEKLVVAYAVSLGPGPENRSVRVVAKDLRTGAVVGPQSIRSPDPLWTTASAAVAECWGALWVLYSESTEGAAGAAARLWLRPLDAETLDPLGDDVPVATDPEHLPSDPSLGSLDGELALLYVDQQIALSGADSATRAPSPLYLQFFDGRTFAGPRLITADGRASQPHAVRVGERLAVIWRQDDDGPLTPAGDRMFQNLALAWVDARGASEPLELLSDRIYADSPSASMVQGRVLVVESRWEHLAGLPDDPALDLGLWATWLDP